MNKLRYANDSNSLIPMPTLMILIPSVTLGIQVLEKAGQRGEAAPLYQAAVCRPRPGLPPHTLSTGWKASAIRQINSCPVFKSVSCGKEALRRRHAPTFERSTSWSYMINIDARTPGLGN